MSSTRATLIGLTLAVGALLTGARAEQVRIVLKNGATVEGERVSESMNFVVVDVDGSEISLFKDMIQDIEAVAAESVARPTRTDATQPPATQPSEADSTSDGEKGSTTSASTENAESMTVAPSIGLEDSTLRSLPRPVFEQLVRRPSQVEVMDLSFMKLDALSPKIALFTRLRRLDLKGNSLETLPSEIGDLTGLEELDLRLNRIKYLPPQIMNLTGLRYLYITANRLSRDELKRLEQQLPFTTIINSPSTIVRDKKTRPSPFSRPELARSDSLDIRCRAGNEQACHHLGDLYANHRDYERALIAYTAGCDLSSPTASAAAQSSCTRAGDIYHYILKNRDRAVQYYEHVCKHIGDNTGEACERLHTVLRRR